MEIRKLLLINGTMIMPNVLSEQCSIFDSIVFRTVESVLLVPGTVVLYFVK